MLTVERPTLRVASFLSSLMYETYAYVAQTVSLGSGYAVEVYAGDALTDFAQARTRPDLAFLCGLLFARMRHWPECPVELLVAPVLSGERYQSRPIYFSDVIARADSTYTQLTDLQGSTWAYNEGASHSGCNLVSYSLLQRGLSPTFFGKTLQSGAHLSSLEMVLDGRAAAAAIDSHILDVFLQRNPQIASQLKIIDTLGPTAIPPVVVAKALPAHVKSQLRDILLHLHEDQYRASMLRKAHIERFVSVDEQPYEAIYHMYTQVQSSPFAV